MEEILKNKIRALEEENKKLKEENTKLRTRAGGDSNDHSENNAGNGFGGGFSTCSGETPSRVSSGGFGSGSKKTSPSEAVAFARPTFMVTERFREFGLGFERLKWKLEARVDQSWAEILKITSKRVRFDLFGQIWSTVTS